MRKLEGLRCNGCAGFKTRSWGGRPEVKSARFFQGKNWRKIRHPESQISRFAAIALPSGLPDVTMPDVQVAALAGQIFDSTVCPMFR